MQDDGVPMWSQEYHYERGCIALQHVIGNELSQIIVEFCEHLS